MSVAKIDQALGQPEAFYDSPSPEPEHPFIREGVSLDRPKTDYGLEVVARDPLWERTIRDIGHFSRTLVTFNDGSQYEDQTCEPLNQRYDVGVTMTTPWWTRLEGYNTEVQKLLARSGVASDLVGPPEFPRGGFNMLRGIKNIEHLVENAHDASAQLVLAREAADKGLFHPSLLMAMGYSRGGMIGWDLLAYDSDFGFNVMYTESNDPCLILPVSIDDIDLKDPGTYKYLPKEFAAMLHAVRNHDFEVLLNMAKTGRAALHVLQHLAVGFALFEGQAGWHLGSIPPGKVGAIRLYDQSLGNQGEVLKSVLSEFPYLYFKNKHGLHMSGMNPTVREAAVGRVLLASRMIEQDEPLSSVAWDTVQPLPIAA